MDTNISKLGEMGFVPVSKEQVAEKADAFAHAFNEMGKNDQKAVADFLETLGVTLEDNGKDTEVQLHGMTIWTARQLSKKFIAYHDLLRLAADRGLDLDDEQIDDIIDMASCYDEWKRHVHPVDALKFALDEYFADDEDEDEDDADDEDCDDEDGDESDEDDDEGVEGHAFIIVGNFH